MTKNYGRWKRQMPGSSKAAEGVEAEVAERVPLRWSFDHQLEFGAAMVSDGLIIEEQFSLAIRHSRATGVTIGYSLVYIGAIRQRHLLMTMEQFCPNGDWPDSMLLSADVDAIQ